MHSITDAAEQVDVLPPGVRLPLGHVFDTTTLAVVHWHVAPDATEHWPFVAVYKLQADVVWSLIGHGIFCCGHFFEYTWPCALQKHVAPVATVHCAPLGPGYGSHRVPTLHIVATGAAVVVKPPLNCVDCVGCGLALENVVVWSRQKYCVN